MEIILNKAKDIVLVPEVRFTATTIEVTNITDNGFKVEADLIFKSADGSQTQKQTWTLFEGEEYILKAKDNISKAEVKQKLKDLIK